MAVLTSAFESRLQRLEELAQQHTRRPCMIVLHHAVERHHAAFSVTVRGESFTAIRGACECWSDFIARLRDQFAVGLLTYVLVAPIIAPAIGSEPFFIA